VYLNMIVYLPRVLKSMGVTCRLKCGTLFACVCACLQEVAKLRKEVQISKAALEASQAAAKKADADLSSAKAVAATAAAGKTAAEKVCCSAWSATPTLL
jgi:hypothetical protein